MTVGQASRKEPDFPPAEDPSRVGTFPALANAGGGYVWDAVLEYRVWCHPEDGAADLEDGGDYFYAFADYPEALAFSQSTEGAQPPLALIRQDEYLSEPEEGQYVHVREVRITEWPVEFLKRPRRNERTIPDFLSPSAPFHRLEVLRGRAK